jgi:NAD(P)-dependent dehydrogenase (short-subunit alcohol dehydrogenase family)
MPKLDLDGRVVLITGGARGIGLATAAACAAAGMKVAIADRDPELTRSAAEALGCGAIGIALDVRDPALFAQAVAEVEAELGPLYALINNAGVFGGGVFAEQDPAAIEQLLRVNIDGVLHGTRLALDRFLPRGEGHVVNLASSAGLVSIPGAAVYGATKHAVIGFTRALRGELRGSGVRTTIVCPGHINTQMTSGFARLRGVRLLEPAQVAEVIVAALRSGRAEVVVPAELGLAARLLAVLPPSAADWLNRRGRASDLVLGGDPAAQAQYARRVADERCARAARRTVGTPCP